MLVKRGICRDGGWNQQECVSVGWGIHHCLSTNVAAGARTIFDDELLSEPYRQPLAHQACENVARASRCKADDNAHWPRWITLRSCNARGRGQRGSTRYHAEKLSAGEFHDTPPSLSSSPGALSIISNNHLNVY